MKSLVEHLVEGRALIDTPAKWTMRGQSVVQVFRDLTDTEFSKVKRALSEATNLQSSSRLVPSLFGLPHAEIMAAFDEAIRAETQCVSDIPPTEFVGALAYVGDYLKTDGSYDYFVMLRCGEREQSIHSHTIRGRAEYEVAELNWLIGGGEQPDILAFDDTPQQPTVVLPGWVLAPLEPDETMMRAGIDSCAHSIEQNRAGSRQMTTPFDDECAAIYTAMLSAAPRAPQAETLNTLTRHRFDDGQHTWGSDAGSMYEHEDGEWVQFSEIAALRQPKQPSDAMVERAARAMAGEAYDCTVFSSQSRERHVEAEWRNYVTLARAALAAVLFPEGEKQ